MNLKKKLFYMLVSGLPETLRHSYYRKRFARVPLDHPEGLSFELARSEADLTAAFKLLHDAYVEQGFITPHESGMRLIVQHALPTTSILIAKLNDRVVGTISVMRDTPLGLPMEKAFDLKEIKADGNRVAELSCLAIHPDFRRNMGGQIFFPLTLFAALFAEKNLGANGLVWNLFPHHADFYNAIFGSKNLTRKSVEYLGAPAAAIYLDFKKTSAFGREKYVGLSPDRDLYTYAYLSNHAHFKLPLRKNGNINYPVLSPVMMSNLFRPLFSEISILEEQVLSHYYPSDSYKVLFRKHDPESRSAQRWDVSLEGLLDDLKIELLDVSITGFKGKVYVDLKQGHEYTLRFANARITATPVWRKEENVYGFRIIEINYNWEKLIESYSPEVELCIA
jgi:ribosomal protein S18 acetylase RimI-like enzyme